MPIKMEKEEANLLQCSKCSKVQHTNCSSTKLNSDIVEMRGNWECLECKECAICNSNNDEDKIIICEMCDRALHIHCLTPPLS